MDQNRKKIVCVIYGHVYLTHIPMHAQQLFQVECSK